MSLIELICLQNIVEIESTFFIIDLKLSKLFKEILTKRIHGLIPTLEVRILFQVLIKISFTNEDLGRQILKDLTNCLVNHWYSENNLVNAKSIIAGIKKFQKLVLFNYKINGSFIKYDDDYILWDLKVNLIKDHNISY
ncbi:MAG: hypothetical protein ACFE9Z_13480 [Promethearchaeota archaeon]